MSELQTADASSRAKDAWLAALDPRLKAMLAKAKPPPPGEEASGHEHAKRATEVDVVALKLFEHATKYGAIRVTGTLKAVTTRAGEGEVAKTYTANDASKRESG